MVIFISPIKIAHPAHIARRKACTVREIRLQELCGCDGCALLRALSDSLTDSMDFAHLRKILRKKLDTGDGRTIIKTVRGVGYKLEADT